MTTTGAAHTPGPWALQPWVVARTHRTIFGVGRVIAHTAGTQGIDVNEANARLIAAAPELLAFAEAFMRRWNMEKDSLAVSVLRPLAEAAIAKAKGRT